MISKNLIIPLFVQYRTKSIKIKRSATPRTQDDHSCFMKQSFLFVSPLRMHAHARICMNICITQTTSSVTCDAFATKEWFVELT